MHATVRKSGLESGFVSVDEFGLHEIHLLNVLVREAVVGTGAVAATVAHVKDRVVAVFRVEHDAAAPLAAVFVAFNRVQVRVVGKAVGDGRRPGDAVCAEEDSSCIEVIDIVPGVAKTYRQAEYRA